MVHVGDTVKFGPRVKFRAQDEKYRTKSFKVVRQLQKNVEIKCEDDGKVLRINPIALVVEKAGTYADLVGMAESVPLPTIYHPGQLVKVSGVTSKKWLYPEGTVFAVLGQTAGGDRTKIAKVGGDNGASWTVGTQSLVPITSFMVDIFD